jgi:UDP-glucose 4-epimerase
MRNIKHKTVVFGGSGFLGSHLADCLADAGHTVTIFDCNPSP